MGNSCISSQSGKLESSKRRPPPINYKYSQTKRQLARSRLDYEQLVAKLNAAAAAETQQLIGELEHK